MTDEYDAAQERGEVSSGRPKTLPDGNTSATAADCFNSQTPSDRRRKFVVIEGGKPLMLERTAVSSWRPVVVLGLNPR